MKRKGERERGKEGRGEKSREKRKRKAAAWQLTCCNATTNLSSSPRVLAPFSLGVAPDLTAELPPLLHHGLAVLHDAWQREANGAQALHPRGDIFGQEILDQIMQALMQIRHLALQGRQ